MTNWVKIFTDLLCLDTASENTDLCQQQKVSSAFNSSLFLTSREETS